MNLRSSLLAVALVATGCAADDGLDDSTGRVAPPEPLALTIEGHGSYSGRAEYEVSEPVDGETAGAELLLSGIRAATGEQVSLRLGQAEAGAIDTEYAFPARENAFLLQLDGKDYEGRFGAVQVDAEDKLIGEFELNSIDLDGEAEVMLKGSFSADRLYLNCNRLVTDKTGSHAGAATDGDGAIWTPDTHLESAFCAAMRDRLGHLYGG